MTFYQIADSPEYVATINVPGYLGMDDEPPTFETIKEAWEWLASERERGEDGADCKHGTCEEALRELLSQDHCGSVHLHTPGYDGDHDLGIMYSVDVVTCVHEWTAGMMIVHPEDLEATAAVREVTCRKCDLVYLA